MAKRKRSRKQLAAARRNIKKAQRVNRRHRGGVRRRRRGARETAAAERPRRRRRRRHARETAAAETKRRGHRKSPKRVKAGKKAARTRARRRAAKRRGSGRARRKGSRRFKRGSSGRRARRAGATRHRKAGYYGPYAPDASERPRRRRRRRRSARETAAEERPRRRRGRRRKKIGYSSWGKRRTRKRRANAARRGWDRKRHRRVRRNPVAGERRRRHRRRARKHHARETRRHRRRNPISNPISGLMEFIGGIAGVGFGFGLADFADRMAITHAYTGTGTAMQDTPAQGAIYNSEALLTPIWTNGRRMLYAALATVAPLTVAHFVNKNQAVKAFLQLMGFGALGRTAGKVVVDTVATFANTNPTVQQFYSGEIAAAGKLNAANVNALPGAPAMTFAGTPRRIMAPVIRPVAGPAPGMAVRAIGAFDSAPGISPPSGERYVAPLASQGVAGQPAAGGPGVTAFIRGPLSNLLNNPDGHQ